MTTSSRKTTFTWGIQGRLIFFSLMFALVPVTFVAIVAFFQARESLQKQIGATVLEIANQAGASLQHFIEFRQDDIEVIARSPILTSITSLSTQKEDYLDSLREIYGVYAAFYVTNSRGEIIAATNQTSGDQSSQPWFQEASQGEVYASDVYYLLSAQRIVITVSSPIRSTRGEFLGVLAGHIDARYLFSVIEQTQVGEGGEVKLLNGEGRVVVDAHSEEVFSDLGDLPPVQAALAGESGTAIFTDHETGEPALFAYIPVEGIQGWYALGTLPLAELSAPAEALATSMALVALIAAAVISVVVFVVARRIVYPIRQLTLSAQQISAGNLAVDIPVQSDDEIGQLADTFRSMAAQLRDFIGTLEERIAARTTDLAITIEVGALATSIRSQDEMLPKIVEFIRARFGLYYTQIYLLDDAKRYAYLRAGTGNIGEQLLARGHRLDMSETSLVATSIRQGTPVLVRDTENSPIHKKNSLLPDTRSEITIPLVVGGEILGVLDMQAARAGAFNDENLGVFQALANQLAAALGGVQAYDEAQAAIARAEAINRRLTSDAWEPYLERLSQDQSVGYEYDLEAAKPLEGEMPTQADNAVFQPVLLRGQQIGIIQVQEDHEREWEQEELRLVHDVAARVGQALEQLRAFDETQAAREEADTLYQIGKRFNEAETEQQLVDAFVKYVTRPGLISVSLTVYGNGDYDTASTLEIVGGWWGDPNTNLVGLTLPISDFPFISLADRQVVTTYNDVLNDPRIDKQSAEGLVSYGTAAMAMAPLTVGRRFVGVLALSSAEPHVHSEREIRLLRALVDPLTTAVERIRLLKETQQRAEMAELLASGNAALSQANDEQQILTVGAILAERYSVSLSTLSYCHLGEDMQPVATEIVSLRSGDGEIVPLDIFPTTYLPTKDFPLASIVYASPDEPVFIGDVETDERCDEGTRSLAATTGSRAFVLIPLKTDQWQGILSFSWQVPQTFTPELRDVFSAIMPNAASVVASRRAFVRMQEAEANVRENQEQLAEAQRIAQLGRWTWYPRTNEVTWNDQLYDLYQIPHDTPATFELYMGLIHPEDINTVQTWLQDALQSNIDTMTSEYRIIRPDGEIRHNSVIGRINRDKDGNLAKAVGIVQDITEQKRQEAERQVLFEAATKLNNAQIADELLDAIIGYARERGALTASLMYLDLDKQGRPEWANIVATWEAEGAVTMPAGSRFYLPDFPFARLWIANSDAPTFVANTEADARLDDTTRDLIAQTGMQGMVLLPMFAQGRWVALATVSWRAPQQFTEVDTRIYTSLMRQATAKADALRAASETQRAREEAETLYRISRRLTNARSLDELLEATVQYARNKDVYSASLMFIDSDKEGNPTWAEIVGTWVADDGVTAPVGTRLYLPEFPFAKLWTATPQEPTLVGDALNDGSMDEATRELFKQFNIAGIALLPLYTQDRWIGLLSFSWNQPTDFTEQDERVFRSITRQATSVADALRSGALTQKRAAELATVAQVSAAATTVLDVNALLQQVSDLTKESFNLYHAHVYLLDDAGEFLVLAAGAGEPGRIMKEQGHSIPLARENSLVARASRTRQGVIANDVTQAANFLPNPLLPDTKSEMAVPMIVGDEVIGVLDVQASATNHFTEEDVRIETTLADQIAIAVRNARAFERERLTAERLREVDRLKSQFLANMSHELRTPLNSIIGYSEVLLDGGDGDLSDDAVEDVQTIHGSGQHLLAIINDILDLAKIEAGQMQISRQSADLVKFLGEIVHAGQILVKDKPVTLTLVKEGDVANVYADPIRLRQIVWNLVSNAVKFTEKGEVTVTVGMQDEKLVYVRVTDTGIGIQPEHVGLVFDQFRQVDGSSTRRAGGTGLGLTITRHLVRLHGGDVYVESEFGEGSSFWFTLPVFAPNGA